MSEESTLTFLYHGEECVVSGTREDVGCLQSMLRSLPKAEEKTLRDMFAAKAMQGLFVEEEYQKWVVEVFDKSDNKEWLAAIAHMADISYQYADAMIEARKVE